MVELSNGAAFIIGIALATMVVGVGGTAYYCGWIHGFRDYLLEEMKERTRLEEWKERQPDG